MIRIIRFSLTLLVLLGLTHLATAQTVVYHLHKENSTTSGLFQLKSTGPDSASAAMVSANLNGAATGEYAIAGFDTQAGDPTYSGTIASGKTVTFALYMRKTANLGAMVPRAKLYLNNSSGTPFCTATGTTALTTTITKYTFSCTTTAAISFTSTDRIYLWVGINLTTASSGGTFQGELDVEGTLNGLYDSQVTVPVLAPVITSLSPTSGPVGIVVTVTGTNFGITQGSSTLKLGIGSITATSWSATQITATIPTGATTNSITVTVGGVASNGKTFTVLPIPTISSLSLSSAPEGTSITITGTNFGATQGASTVTFNGSAATPTSWASTQIKAPVPGGATTGNVIVTVSGVSSVGTPFTVVSHITSVSPGTSLVGASVTITGTTFGATQGTSTVKFNGTAGTPSSWASTQIVVPVPLGATTGNVVVSVANNASNGVPFTVLVPTSTLVWSDPAPSASGQQVTISSQVMPSGTGAPTGIVSIEDNGTTIGSGSLIPSATISNKVLYSSQFDNTQQWTLLGGVTATPNYTTSPAGDVSGYRLQSLGSSAGGIYQNVTGLAGQTVTFSLWVLSNTSSAQYVHIWVVEQGLPIAYGSRNCAIETTWQRCTVTASIPSTSGGIWVLVDDLGPWDISIWGAQLESGNSASPYIPTTTSTVSSTARFFTLNTSTLSSGLHPLSAAYAGDSTFGASTSAVLTQTVSNPTSLTLATTSLPDGTQNMTYNVTLQASGGQVPYVWTANGILPVGLQLEPDGTLTGTPTGYVGTSFFLVQLQDANGSVITSPLSITIHAGQLTITTTSLPPASANTPYSAALTAVGGTLPYTWSIVAGALPPGLSLNSNGTISGVTTDNFTGFVTFQVIDAASNTATVGFYMNAISATQIPTSMLLWSVPNPSLSGQQVTFYTQWTTAGTLSPYGSGIQFQDGDSTIADLVRVPINPTNKLFFSSLFDNAQYWTTFWASLTPNFTSSPIGDLTAYRLQPQYQNQQPDGGIYQTVLGLAGQTATFSIWMMSNTEFTQQINIKLVEQGSGSLYGSTTCLAPLTWQRCSVTAVIPSGSTAVLARMESGPPWDISIWGAQVETAPSAGPYASTTYTQDYSNDWIATYTTSTLSDDSHIMKAVCCDTTVVIDANYAGSSSAPLTQVVGTPPPSLTITTTSLPDGMQGVPYSGSVQATGGTPPYSWTIVAGSLPFGLTMDQGTGIVAGTPTGGGPGGTTFFTIQVRDTITSVTKSIGMTIQQGPLIIATTTLPYGFPLASYTATLYAAGGTPPYTWSVSSGNLPTGLTLNSVTGVLEGSPSANGTNAFTIQVQDNGNSVTSKQMSIQVGPITSNCSGFIPTCQVYEVTYRSYIPLDWVRAASPCWWHGFLPLPVNHVYRGNAYQGAYGYKTKEVIQVEFDIVPYGDGTVTRRQQQWGWYQDTDYTMEYGRRSPINGSTISDDPPPEGDFDNIAYDCDLWNQTKKAVPNFYYFVNFGDNIADIEFWGQGSIPTEPQPFAGAIKWDVDIKIDNSNPQQPTAVLSNWSHTCFPAHEVLVNDVSLYNYQPRFYDFDYIAACLTLPINRVNGPPPQLDPKNVCPRPCPQ